MLYSKVHDHPKLALCFLIAPSSRGPYNTNYLFWVDAFYSAYKKFCLTGLPLILACLGNYVCVLAYLWSFVLYNVILIKILICQIQRLQINVSRDIIRHTTVAFISTQPDNLVSNIDRSRNIPGYRKRNNRKYISSR